MKDEQESKDSLKKTRAPRTYDVRLKKAAWINGELIGNTGAELKVTKEVRDQLKASRILDEDSE